MLKVGFMVCFNEADYIKYSIESVIENLDKLIIIEGSWAEYYLVNGKMRSDDGTIDIIKELQSNHKDKIELYFCNENSQLEQRNLYWNYCPKEDHVMILVDADEVWTDEQILKSFNKLKEWPRSCALPLHVYTVESLIFINDFYNVSKVRYPRLWEIEHGCKYKFVEPNRITSNDLDFDIIDLDCHYFHYSYTHSAARFTEKKKERTKLHGSFAWDIVGETVRRPEATIRPYTGCHPKGIQSHPLFGVKKHKEIAKPEIIVYIEHSGIGNLVLSTPMLKAIRKHKPNAKIYVMSWKRAARILEGADYIDHIYSVDEAFTWNQKIDHLLISPVGSMDGFVKGLSQHSKRVYRLPPMQPWTEHESDRKMLLARKLGYKGPTPKPEIKIFDYNVQNAYDTMHDTEAFNKFISSKKCIAICAAYLKTEHWHLKHFGDNNFTQLLLELHKKYPEYIFIFVGSNQDRSDADRIIANMNPMHKATGDNNNVSEAILTSEVPLNQCVNLCGFSDDIKDTAAVLNQSEVCVGNDSGLMHIASAIGVPTVTIFTFTNPVKNQPIDGKIVMNPCAKRLSCQHGKWDKCKENGCLDVPVERVFDEVCKML